MCTDKARQFPVLSSQGNRYIMVLCQIDGNFTLVEWMKNGTSGEMCKAYDRLMQRLQNSDPSIKNTSYTLKHQMTSSRQYEKTELSMKKTHHTSTEEIWPKTELEHWKTISKQYLQWKNETLPMYFLDRLLPQAKLTLNMLQPTNIAWQILIFLYPYLYLISTCFVFDVVLILLAINIAPMLSTFTLTGYLTYIFLLPNNLATNINSLTASYRLHTLPLSWKVIHASVT